jgi:hypothetical protein
MEPAIKEIIISTRINADFRERIQCEAGFAKQKVLKGILKGKPAPDVPVFQEFSLKLPKAIDEVYL